MSKVGNETKANMRGVGLEGGNVSDLSAAVKHLHEQHPIKHDDLGPHHGKDHHVRHEPMHGMKPCK